MEDGDDETRSSGDGRPEPIQELLSRIVGIAAVSEIDLPHIVVCRDDETGAVTYSGPFPDAVAALVFAERERVVDGELNAGSPLCFGIAALFPAPGREGG